ncbi:MAG: hypothetical protein OEY86_09100 [Nitrospira sp.]|nr:hypothetical protein [Nitrospira sp.]
MPNDRHINFTSIILSEGVPIMKHMLMAILAVAVAVTFTAPAFAGKKKDEKKGGDVVVVYAEKKKKDDGGHFDQTFDKKKKDEEGK